jgi:nitrogen regulatory protein P-II 1
MKKIEAIIPPSTLNQAIQAIRKVGVGGLTVIHAQGLGSADPPLVGQFFSKETLVVVDDDKVDDVMLAIANVSCTGAKGDGKIFVTNVEESMDICTKEKGIHTL